MPLSTPVPDFAASSLADLARWTDGDALPPVDSWHPAQCGSIDIRISSDGRWWHEGGEIARPAMVRLFSRVLRREADGSFVLVTPAEKLTIAVDDAPFVAVEVKCEGEGTATTLAFRLNTGEVVIAGPTHPISVSEDKDGLPRPVVHVRGGTGNGLEARMTRAVWLELADMALTSGEDPPSLWSGGARFALLPG